MHALDLLQPSRISVANEAASKKRVLEEAASLLAGDAAEPTDEQIFERLLERERLGSTGLAGGVALPHARMPGLDDVRGAFLRLAQAVDFDAMDGQPVDLVFALLVPEEATEEHLQLLAGLARLFSDPTLCTRLRDSADPDAVIEALKGEAGTDDTSGAGPGSVRLPA
jgi:PTS system nitrogen regulatory IIA component